MTCLSGTGDGPVLVVAAHADDEVLGCGGTMARLARSGREVHVMFMTDGVSARAGGDAAARQEAAREAASVLGASEPVFASFPDNAMDTAPLLDVARAIEARVADIRPSCVLTHHHGDLNVDHQVSHRAVLTACRPQPGHPVKAILTFSVRSSTEWGIHGSGHDFQPVLHVDISGTLPLKLQALQAYDMEMRAFPHSRSLQAVEAEAKVLGASVGLKAVESFAVIRLLCPDA
jgi:LmbE family N-acetylglucosaminyl deacetylase